MATEDEWNKNLTEKLKEISMLMKMMNPLIHKNVNEYMKPYQKPMVLRKYKKRKNKKPYTSSQQQSSTVISTPVDGTQSSTVNCSDPINPPKETWLLKVIDDDSEEVQNDNSSKPVIYWNPVQ